MARRVPSSSSSAPLLWRMRHKVGRVWFFIALGMIGLGGFVTLYGMFTGLWDMLGVGLTLMVGGALLAVGFRAKR